MRLRSRMAALAVVAPLAAATLTFSTGAATTPPAKAAPKDNCAVSSTQRVGAWTCLDQAQSRAQMERYIASQRTNPPTASSKSTVIQPTTVAVQPATTASAQTSGDGKTGWCSTVGCWYLYRGDNSTTEYHASEYDGTGFYGYGSETIGSVSFHIYDYLPNSTQVKITNQHKTSTAASPYNVWWDSNMLVSSSYPSGKFCETSAQSASVPTAAGVTSSWDGLYLTQCIYSTQATQHSTYWRDYNYPGRWYHYAKSAKFNHELGYQSHYLGDWDTPSAPTNNAGSGWQNV